MDQVFEGWTREEAAAWGQRPGTIRHRLHASPLFSLDGLAELIDRYPKENYSLIRMGAVGDRRDWREGERGELSGAETIEAIRLGRMWLNLRDLARVDDRYGRVVERLFAEFDAAVPGPETFGHRIGLLISSPSAQVYYHADLPGQALFQIHGRKRVYVYPASPPYLTPEHLEHIALGGVEVDMPYERRFDEGATVVDLEPGLMAHWPLNAPHRIENLGVLNVSMTMEYWTDDIRRRHMVNLANGLLRQRLGLTPKSRATSGPGFLAKAALQAAARRSGYLNRAQSKRRPVEFALQRRVDLAPAPLTDQDGHAA